MRQLMATIEAVKSATEVKRSPDVMAPSHLVSCVIPGWPKGPDLRCAIAHRGISMWVKRKPIFGFRVHRCAMPRNDAEKRQTL